MGVDDFKEIHVTSLEPGDVILWGNVRTIESVAGNALAIVATFKDGSKPATWHKGAKVWAKVS